MEKEININEFDNEISILYKWSEKLETPVKYLVIIPKEGQIVTEGILDIITEMIKNNDDIMKIYESLNENRENILIKDLENELGVIYYLIKSEISDKREIIDEINEYYKKIGINMIMNINDMENNIEIWKRQYNKEYIKDQEILETLNGLEEELEKQERLIEKKLVIDKIKIDMKTKLKENEENISLIEYGIDIFNYSITNKDIPYIQYNGEYDNNGNPKKYYKIYTGETSNDKINYEYIIPEMNKTDKKNMIYLMIWLGEGVMKRTTKESYKLITYDLETKIMTTTIPITDKNEKEMIKEKIEKYIPIEIININENKVSGDSNIYDIEIIEPLFLDMLLNEPLMNSYLYIDEVTKSSADKKRLTVHFKSIISTEEKKDKGYITNPSSVKASISQLYIETDQNIKINEDTEIPIEKNTPYIYINIIRAESRKIAEQFLNIFNRLLSFYKSRVNDYKELYEYIFPKTIFEPKKEPKIKPIKKTKRAIIGSNLDLLQENAPDIFVDGYARICQSKAQPKPIASDEIDEWINNKFAVKGVDTKRQIMRFPKDNPYLNLVCPTDEYPYPGVKENKTLSNKQNYPYVPCCFKVDQTVKKSSKYNQYYEGKIKEPPKVETKSAHKIKTNKILQPKSLGFLPTSIFDLLKNYSPETRQLEQNLQDKLIGFARYGVPQNANSLLYCISEAINDPNYISLETLEEKDLYISKLRSYISSNINLSLLKQELYDFSDQEILLQLNDDKQFLDPSLYYRAIEEIYNVNIYVFTLQSESISSLELPRFKLFHAQPYRNRNTIVIYKNYGSESDNLQYPQCELIVFIDSDQQLTDKIFPSSMSNLLYESSNSINKILSWSFTNNSLNSYQNLFSYFDFYNFINNSASSQFIDSYGKLRGFIFPYDNNNITIIFPSSQPENLPISDTPTNPPYSSVFKLFGKPSSVYTYNNQVVGLWYQFLNLTYGIYCPIDPTLDLIDYEQGPPNPLFPQGYGIVSIMNKLYRDLNFIMQLVIWLLLISGLSYSDFLQTYSLIGSGSSSSYSVYDFSSLPRILPSFSSIDDALVYLNQYVPTFIIENKIYFYSQKFYDGITYHLRLFENLNSGLEISLPTQINNFYRYESDFIQYPHSLVFINESDFTSWLSSISLPSYNNIIIYTNILSSYSSYIEPYIYLYNNHIFLVQNVKDSDFLRAINVSYLWQLFNINFGFSCSLFTTQPIPPHIIYSISSSNQLILLSDNSNNFENPLFIMDYGNNNFSSLLPIL